MRDAGEHVIEGGGETDGRVPFIAHLPWEGPNASSKLSSRNARRGRRRYGIGGASAGSETGRQGGRCQSKGRDAYAEEGHGALRRQHLVQASQQGACSSHGGVAKWFGKAPSNMTARCTDGEYWTNEERRGACSQHGGVAFWLGKAKGKKS